MLSINTNLSSLITQSSLKESTNKLNLAIERMSTGFKVNHAKDNAANYSISTNMTTRINSYMVAEDNAAMGLDMISTAEGTLSQIQDKLSRLRALAEQSANGTYGEQSKQAINAEANALVDEISRIYNTTSYNGVELLKSNSKTVEQTIEEKYAENDGFVNKVTRRDTTTMTSVAEEYNNSGYLDAGSYSISTTEEFAMIAEMINEDDLGSDVEIVLANNIDMSGYTRTISGTLAGGNIYIDGNGYSLSNLSISLFNGDIGVDAKNLGLKDVNISGGNMVGALTAHITGDLTIDNCFITGSVTGDEEVGAFVGRSYNKINITNSYSNCEVNGNASTGTLVGWCDTDGNNIALSNVVLYSASDLNLFGTLAGDPTLDTSVLNSSATYFVPTITPNNISLQVGINNNSSSQINFQISFDDFNTNKLYALDFENAVSLNTIDEYLSKVSSKQVELGAISNRLESVLDEIAIQYDNLVSSRSTIRDADIAEVSANYIQQQILQQASATLLATANQSPSIALQLI